MRRRRREKYWSGSRKKRQMTADLQDYRKFLEGLRLRHFRPAELLGYRNAERDGVRNALPPRALWRHIVVPLWVADQLREHLGARCTITSSYRSPAYNAVCPGAVSGSQHTRNCALDLVYAGVSTRVVANRLLALRRAGAFRGGIGRYDGFVHLDNRGYAATWGL